MEKAFRNYKRGKLLVNISINRVHQIIQIYFFTALVYASETQLRYNIFVYAATYVDIFGLQTTKVVSQKTNHCSCVFSNVLYKSLENPTYLMSLSKSASGITVGDIVRILRH